MNHPLLNKIKRGKILISDGAWGTQLQAIGLAAGDCPELWNKTHPDQVKAVAAAYVDAGSDIILTNTFGGSKYKLAHYDCEHRVEELNEAGVVLSRNAAKAKTFVVASIGPTGKFLEPLGDISEDDMQQAFRQQVKAHLLGGADAILIETMADLNEAKLAMKAVRAVCSLPVLVTMTFEAGNNGYRTMMGVSIEQATKELIKSGADVIGTNCGNGIEQMCDIIAEMRSLTTKPLIAHPNAGLPQLVNGETVFSQSAAEFAAQIPRLIESGANIIGGCCGTTPEHIRAIVDVVRGLNTKEKR